MTIRVCDRCKTRINEYDGLKTVTYNFSKNERKCLELCKNCVKSFRLWMQGFDISVNHSKVNENDINILKGDEKPSNPCLKCDFSVRQACTGCQAYYKWIDEINDCKS